jgi:16S rRNA G966 N2-methylase RsmD
VCELVAKASGIACGAGQQKGAILRPMSACCNPDEYDAVFSRGYARRTARSLRSSGLDHTSAQMADFIVEQGLEDATVLEIGGGVGGLHLELLRRGASTATNVELSRAYEAEARRLQNELGLADRVQRCILDVAANPEAVERADVVVLHRVVCCYPDYAALLGAAADRARRVLAFSYPKAHLLNRVQTALENVTYAVRGKAFRTFVHSPEKMLEVLTLHGYTTVRSGSNRMWQFAGAVRIDS